MSAAAERMSMEDDPESIFELYCRNGWTDGLPIIPPTPVRVERMLAGANPDRLLGLIPPAQGEATLGRIAVNAVMAGCAPAYFPAVVAALAAVLDPSFNLRGVQSTTGAATPLILLNGPARRTLAINCGAGALGVGTRSNATIGRAVRLCLLTVGEALPGLTDMASLGQPGKYTFCFGENEEESPWEPFHVERGFAPDESTVTAIAVSGSIEVQDSRSKDAAGVIKTMARSMLSAAFVAGNQAGDGGHALVVFTPEHARQVAAGHLTKSDLKRRLWEEAWLSIDSFPPEMAAAILAWQGQHAPPADGKVRVTRRPEDLLVVVAGGIGIKSAFIPTWGDASAPVTRPIGNPGRMPTGDRK